LAKKTQTNVSKKKSPRLDQEKIKSSRDRLFEMSLISTEDELFKFAEKKKVSMNPINLHYIFKELMLELEEKKKKSEREQKKQRQRLVRDFVETKTSIKTKTSEDKDSRKTIQQELFIKNYSTKTM
jgi:hypothetical protein